MKKVLSTLFFIILILPLNAQDTGETKSIGGKTFKVHKVQAGETVFALSRTYEISASDIMDANPSAKDGLSIGQEILIPVREVPKAGITHTVAAGETLFAISRKYNVDVADIQKLNDMSSSSLSAGQVLIIKKGEVQTKPVVVETSNDEDLYTVKAGETLFAISRKFNVSVDDISKWNNLQGSAITEGQKIRVKSSNSTTTSTTAVVKTGNDTNTDTKEVVQKKEDTQTEKPVVINSTPRTSDDFVEVKEDGVAELIPDTENTRKYLALHRSVKPGTIIRVRNEMNGREVWARVIGKLPETGENRNILVKVSKAAFDRLGAMDKKFRVTITYIP